MTDELHDLAPLYVLDGLDEAERTRFERHLSGCARCQAEVTELSETLAAMGQELAVEAPPDMKSRVMDEIAGTPQWSGADPATTDDGSAPEMPAGGGSASGEEAEVVDLVGAGERRDRRLIRRMSVWLTSAAVLVAVVAAGLVLVDRTDPDPYADLVAADDAEILELDGDAGELTVVYSPNRNKIGVSSDSLPDPGAGSTYALWFVVEDGVVPAALFEPTDGVLRTTVDVDDIDPAGFGVTVEPDGGSPQPTGDIILVGERNT